MPSPREILYLLTLPELESDAFFRDKATGNLKKEFRYMELILSFINRGQTHAQLAERSQV
jgi:hypothetical protein